MVVVQREFQVQQDIQEHKEPLEVEEPQVLKVQQDTQVHKEL